MNEKNCQREFDFALVIDGVSELTAEVENALFEGGCSDATFSMQYGHLYAEFSRAHDSIAGAIISAICDVRKAVVGAVVICVDACDLVTQSEIARRIGRSRQLISQYISGQRGPGNFPPPECHISDDAPLWRWCAVSYWLAENNIIRREENWNAEVIAAINNALERLRQIGRNPELMKEISKLAEAGCGPCQ
jgi:hypothetical protein